MTHAPARGVGKKQDRITAKDPRPPFSVPKRNKFGGVKEKEKKEEEEKKKKSIC